MVPAVQTGEYDFAITNPLTIMQANDAGLDMRILTGFAYAYPEGEDTNAVVTRKDTGIEDFGHLAGREVAINTLETQGDLSIMEATERRGGEATDIRFSEIAFPEMEPQLDLGNVDAIWLPEPLLSKALANPENAIVGYSTQESVPGMPMLSTFTSAKYAEEILKSSTNLWQPWRKFLLNPPRTKLMYASFSQTSWEFPSKPLSI